MSITLLNTSYGYSGLDRVTASLNHIHPTGANLIVAFLSTRASGAYITSQAAKWDGSSGTSFTLLGYKDHSSTLYLTVSVFYIFPAAANVTKEIYMSWTTGATGIAGAFSMSGADTPLASSIQSTGGTGSPMQRDIASAVGDLVLAGISMEGNTDDTLTPITGVTESWNQKASNVFSAGAYRAGASPTATIGWNIGNRSAFLGLNIPATAPVSSFIPRNNFT